MKDLVETYARKLAAAGLAEPGEPLVAGLDADLVWNRDDPVRAGLEKVFERISINSLLFCRPREPYASIMDYLASNSGATIRPSDCETRTFLHEIPVCNAFEAGLLADALAARKGAVIPGCGILAYGTVTPEQAFIVFSSICFSLFVKFFADCLEHARSGCMDAEERRVFEAASKALDPIDPTPPILARGPFLSEDETYGAICQAGRKTVEYGLVDSFFGNVSYLFDETLYISQTTSSLDELEGCIDPCALDGSSCAGITASSELTAHREIVTRTGKRAVLHGHPKFSVILSLDCDRRDCPGRGACHLRCSESRQAGGVPIVPGEVGTGPTGLCNTLPPAMQEHPGAIVYGHGLFATGADDFNEAFKTLLTVERACREEYFQRFNRFTGNECGGTA